MFEASIFHEIDKLEVLLQTRTEVLPYKLKAANQQNFGIADNASEVSNAPTIKIHLFIKNYVIAELRGS